MKKRVLLLVVVLSSSLWATAQNVGISDVSFTPNPQAILDLSADRKGFLPPRIALVDANDPISGVKPQGLMVYNQSGSISGGNGYYYWDGSAWQKIPNTNNVVGGSGTLNYLSKWTPDGNTLGNSLVFDNGSNVGIGTSAPASRLNLRDGQESATQTDFTQGIGQSGLLITSDYTDNTYVPGLFWNTANNNPTKPKAGIYLHQNAAGSKMILATTTNFASGIDNNGIVINDLGNVGVGVLSPAHRLSVGDATADGQPVTVRGYSNIGNWKGGGAFGYTGAAVILGELNGVAQIGGHNSTLGAWADLAINASGGNVGIGTTVPAAKFHLHTTGTGGLGISDDGWASIRMDGQDNKSLWMHYGAAGTNELRFARTSDGFGSWEANVVRLDLDAPDGSFVVDGTGILSSASLAGTGTRMLTATAVGAITTQALPGGVLPAGSAAQTLYHNGTSWVSTSNLSNDGATINLGNFNSLDQDQWPLVTWIRDFSSPIQWDEGLIKGSSSRGVWGRPGFGIHMNSDKHFGFFSSGWDPLFDVEGGTGRVYIKGNTGIGNNNPTSHLQVGAASSDGQPVTVRGYSNTGSWKGGGAFGYTGASVIMGELGGVAQIGGHNGTLGAWSNLAINSGGGYVGIGLASPQSLLHVMGKVNIHQYGSGGGQNLFQGIESPTTANGRAQLVLSSSYSDLVIASSQANDNHGSTLTFATYDPGNAASYRKWAINQGNWGARSQFLDFGYGTASNPHSFINSGSVSMTLDGTNRRMGIQTMNPQVQLEVGHNGAASYGVGIMLNQNVIGNSDGPKMQFRKTMTSTKDWSVGILNGVDVGTFTISEDAGIGGFGTSRVSIVPGGNVGLGTTNPSGRLHIAGNNGNGIYTDGNDRPGMGATGVYPQMVMMSGNSGNGNHGATFMVGGYDSGASGAHKHWSIGTSGANSTFLDIGYHAGTDLNPHAGIRNYNGTTMMTILNTGNVGINTIAPEWKFHVEAVNTPSVLLRQNGTHSYGTIMGLETYDNGSQTQDGPKIGFHKRGAKIWAAGIEPYTNNGFTIWEDGYNGGWGTQRLTIAPGGYVGIGNSAPTQKLDVSGTVRGSEVRSANGIFRSETRGDFYLALQGDRNMVLYDGAAIWATGTTVSDIRTKKDIRSLEETLPTLMKLSAIRFKYNEEENLGDDDHVGVIAQEILEYYPDMVYHDKPSDRYIVHYDKLTTVLLKGIQELQGEVEELKSANAALKSDNKELTEAVSSLQTLQEEVEKIKATIYQEAKRD